MTRRETEILNTLKIDPGFRALQPNGMKWAVVDYRTAPRTILIDNIRFNTVNNLYYSDAGITDTDTNFLQYTGA